MKPWTPIQNTAPVANDISWYVIAAAIIAGSAFLSYGIASTAHR